MSTATVSELQAFERILGEHDARVLIVCDHASAFIPASLGTLGLSDEDRASHIAWDIGAALVTRRLARCLGCPAVLAGASRLVIDCNRQPGDPSSIPAVTGGIVVPGNQDVDEAEADRRAEAWFHPYHHQIATVLGHLWRRTGPPAVLAIHSFTPVFEGMSRPWHAGVLSNRDRRMADTVLRGLAALGGLEVGDNRPYSGREINYTLDTHAGAAGLPHVSFEIRQDLIADAAGADHWAGRLASILAPILADPGLYRAETA